MFHGQPYCRACEYEGPDFMWSYHFNRGFRALIQDGATLALRTVPVPDDEVYYRKGVTPDERQSAIWDYVDSVVVTQLSSGERHILHTEFARFADDERDKPDEPTDLPCPRCRVRLFWRHTGIS